MVGERYHAPSYPPLGVPVADGNVEGEGDKHGEEDRPLHDDAGLYRGDSLLSVLGFAQQQNTIECFDDGRKNEHHSPSNTKRE